MGDRDKMRAALWRIADPRDKCHCGYEGPWQEVAQEALGWPKFNDAGDLWKFLQTIPEPPA